MNSKKDILYPLRRLHGRLYEWKKIKKRKADFLRTLMHPLSGRVFVFGTPDHENMGDSAIVLAEMRFLKSVGIDECRVKEITVTEYFRFKRHVDQSFNSSDVICWHGGGNMGNLWPSEERFRQQMLRSHLRIPVVFFPQTIDYSEQREEYELLDESYVVYNNRRDLTLIAREVPSYNTMLQLYPDTPVLLTPDIVLSATAKDFCVESQLRQGILLCMRTDIERSLSDDECNAIEKIVNQKNLPCVYTDMYSNCPVTKQNRAECVRAKMQEFAGAKLVITDRLHGMVFAAITGTPCIAFSNNNHKVKGTYEWIRYLPYIRYAESVEDVEKYLPELLAMENCEYDNAPLMPYFDKIAEVVKKYAAN